MTKQERESKLAMVQMVDVLSEVLPRIAGFMEHPIILVSCAKLKDALQAELAADPQQPDDWRKKMNEMVREDARVLAEDQCGKPGRLSDLASLCSDRGAEQSSAREAICEVKQPV